MRYASGEIRFGTRWAGSNLKSLSFDSVRFVHKHIPSEIVQHAIF